MEVSTFIDSFNEDFYDMVYSRWRISEEKAGKDIVGEQWELFRSSVYKQHGFTTADDRTIGGYNADIVVVRNGEAIIVEEAKGHYIDSCFLQRAISSCARVISDSLEKEREPPHFVLSCPTKMNNFQEVFDSQATLYRKDIRNYLSTKFTYLPLCSHGRVPKKRYYNDENNCFSLDANLIERQLTFLENLKV
jgi:hypothetical protein